MGAIARVRIILECSLNEPLRSVVLMEIEVGVCGIKGRVWESCGEIFESTIGESSSQPCNEYLGVQILVVNSTCPDEMGAYPPTILDVAAGMRLVYYSNP